MKPFAAALALTLLAGSQPALGFDWTGFYAGLGIGGLSGNYEDYAGGTILRQGTTLEGFAGFRLEALIVTLGAEVDASYRLPFDGSAGPTSVGRASAKATMGMELGPLMPFVSAGAAISRQDQGSGVSEETYPGLVVGAGLDLGVTDHLFARAEASYTVFAHGDPTAPSLSDLTSETNLRAGLGWKF